MIETEPLPENADWFLRTLVNIVNNADREIGITLQVGGLLVSGILVGGSKYFEGFAAEFASTYTGEDAESIKEAFLPLARVYKPKENPLSGYVKRDSVAEEPPAAYIHLKEAKFFSTTGNPIPANRGVWWRGRLSEVSGFVLGNLNAAKT